jgi:hypothetical protein
MIGEAGFRLQDRLAAAWGRALGFQSPGPEGCENSISGGGEGNSSRAWEPVKQGSFLARALVESLPWGQGLMTIIRFAGTPPDDLKSQGPDSRSAA